MAMQDQATGNKYQAPEASASAAAAPKTADDRSTAFRAVQGGSEMQSGEKLLVEAYVAIWVITLIFLVSIFRRQKRIDDRITSLEGALDKARDRAGAK
jgi:CcmD family protein